MHAKHNDPRKPKPGAPSTGRGAASAMDALIQKRVPAPGSGPAPQPQQQQQPKHSKKH
ncbi:MAG: hypothetical protein Q8R01_15640 [Ramlibacter sp.]|nr:hypothetical protein [Ramlibacter sp.]